MIDGAPQVSLLLVDLHEHLVEVPSPVARSHALNPALPDLGRKSRTKPLPPEPDRLVADIDAPLVKQVFNVPERKREADVHHHRQTDDFKAAVEALEQVRFAHPQTLRTRPTPLKAILSDKTVQTV